MIEKILQKAVIILIGMIKSGIVGAIVAVLTTGGNPDIIPAALLFMLFLLPAMFLYHLGKVLSLKRILCDIFYFIGFISVLSFFICGSCMPDNEGGDNLCRWIVYTLFFSGIAVYLTEVIFRDQKCLKESRYQSQLTETNWKSIFGQIFKQPKTIFFFTIRSYIIAAMVMSLAGIGSYFVDLHIDNLIFVRYGFLFSFCLLPAIILYRSSCSLKLKQRTSDVIFFVVVLITELFFLPSVLKMNVPQYVTDPEYQLCHLPLYAMSIIALGSIFVYMTEVYFRNRTILKSLGRRKVS